MNNTYTWSADFNGTSANGTVFTVFLAGLNRDVSADGIGTCFANHCDWRLPNIAELRTILISDVNIACSAASPCIDPAFGPIYPFNYYWSSTLYSAALTDPWVVSFVNGVVSGGLGNRNTFPVRAVRFAR